MVKRLKKRADGRYMRQVTVGIDYATGNKVTKTLYAYTIPELERKVSNLLAQYEYIDYNDLTVKQYAAAYIDQRKKELVADNGLITIEGYERTFDTYVVPVIGKYKLVDVTTPILRNLINNIKMKHKNYTGQRTKQYVYTVLNLLFKRAFKDSLIAHNPMLPIDKPKHVHEEAGVIDVAQLNTLLKLARSEDAQIARLLDVLFDSAVRRSEVAAFRYYDINFKKLTISVARSIKKTRTKGLIENEPKTKNSKRTMLMSQYTMSVLAEQLKYVKSKVKAAGLEWSDNYHVFIDDDLQPLKPDLITRIFSRYRDQLGLPKNVTLKSLRHSCATLLSEEDISPKKIQLKLGHASAAFTLDRYNHNTINMQKSVARTLGNIRKSK